MMDDSFNNSDKKENNEKKVENVNYFKKNQEQVIIDRTLEINRLIKDKARFIDNLSHDLATPITPLLTLLPMIKEHINEPKYVDLIDVCIRNVEYINRVINNVRELAEISSSDLFLKRENLYQLIENIKQKYDVVFKSYNIEVQNKVPKEQYIKTDKNRFSLLLDHLFSNAINSMSNGGVLTFESKGIETDSKPYIKISVSDTGLGLNREELDHIFDEFYKTDVSRHKLDSTGLGLTICKEIINKHGGKIWADSHGDNSGTTIFFTIPSEKVVFSRSF